MIDWAVGPDWTGGIEALPKIAVYGALLLAVGSCGARWLSRTLVARQSTERSAAHPDRPLGALLLTAAVAFLVALLVRAWAHTVVAFGLSDARAWVNLRLIGWESHWGGAWRVQVACALALVGAALLARWAPRSGWLGASAVAVAGCYALPLLGHAEGEPARVILHGSHVLGAGLWLGTLAALRLAHRDHAALDRHLTHVAPLALSGALALAITGALSAYSYLGVVSNLWTHPYGRSLLLKLAVVIGVVTCGFVNWRHYRAIESSPRRTRVPSTVTAELLLAALAVVITAVLTELPHP